MWRPRQHDDDAPAGHLPDMPRGRSVSAGESSGRLQQDPTVCRILRCGRPARWIVTVYGHPNTPQGSRSAYCLEHAEGSVRLLWDGSPRPYVRAAEGPYPDAAALRAAYFAERVTVRP
jgi:hypothetical protein